MPDTRESTSRGMKPSHSGSDDFNVFLRKTRAVTAYGLRHIRNSEKRNDCGKTLYQRLASVMRWIRETDGVAALSFWFSFA